MEHIIKKYRCYDPGPFLSLPFLLPQGQPAVQGTWHSRRDKLEIEPARHVQRLTARQVVSTERKPKKSPAPFRASLSFFFVLAASFQRNGNPLCGFCRTCRYPVEQLAAASLWSCPAQYPDSSHFSACNSLLSLLLQHNSRKSALPYSTYAPPSRWHNPRRPWQRCDTVTFPISEGVGGWPSC